MLRRTAGSVQGMTISEYDDFAPEYDAATAAKVWAALDGWTLGWLFAGGIAYTLGTWFYHRRSLPHAHAIWHLFVIAGGICHFVAISAQVLPSA